MKTFYKIEELLQISCDGCVGSGPRLFTSIFMIPWKIFEIQNNSVCKFNSYKDYAKLKHRFKEFVK